MKKLLGIIVLGFLLGGNAYAEVSTELCHYCARDIYARILVK